MILSFINLMIVIWGTQFARDLSLPETYIKEHRWVLLFQSMCIILAVNSLSILLFRSRIKKELFPDS